MTKKSATANPSPASSRRLVVAPYFPDLEEAFLAAVRARRDPLEPIWTLAPTGEMQRRLRSRLAASGGALNVHFFSFESLGEELAAPAAARLGLAKLPPGGDFLLMEEILREVDLGYFAPAKNEARFSSTLLATLRDLRDAGVSPPMLQRAAKSRIGPPGKLESLARIANAWAARLEKRRLFDRPAGFEMAIDEVTEGRARLPEPFLLLVYGVADFTGVQRRLLEALAARATTLHVFSPPEHVFSKRALRFFRDLKLEEISSAAAKPSPASPSQELRRVSAAGRAEEVRECLREVQALLESGFRPEEIGIVARQVQPYDALLRDRFAAEEIPLAPAALRTLAASEAGLALLAACRLRESPVTRPALVSWLQSPALDLVALSGESDPPLVEWDRRLREAGVVQLDGPGGFWETRAPGTGLGRALAALDSLLLEGAPSRVGQALEAFVAKHFLASEERESLREKLSELANLDALRTKIETGELAPLLESALESVKIEARRGGIFFGDAMSARGISFRALFVLGLAAKEFPRLPPSDPALLDGEREALAAQGAVDLQPKSRAEEEEPFLFEGLRASARERLFFLRPRLDPVTGREILPSLFWGEAKTEQRAPLRFWSAASRGAPASLLEFDLRRTDALLRLDRDTASAYLREVFPASVAPGLDLETQRWSAGRYTPFDGDVGAEMAAKLSGLHFSKEVAPTRLESLAACPFRFFLESGLQIAAMEEPESENEMDSRERGALLHKTLAAFFAGLEKGKTLDAIPRAALDERLDRVFAACWKEKEKEGIPGAWADREALRQEMLAQLRVYLAQEIEEKASVPLEVEWPIPPGIEFRAGKHTLLLRGRVDRIDPLENGSARVVDFKSGKRPSGIGTLQGGRRIQVPLYSYVAAKEMGRHPIVGEYHYFRDGKRATLDHDGDSLALRTAVETLLDLGRAGLYPQVPNLCHSCQVKLACPSEPEPLFQRKQGDPRFAAYLSMHRGDLEPEEEEDEKPKAKPRAKSDKGRAKR